MNIALVLLSWPLLALLAFKTLAPQRAVMLIVFGGWILLPVGIYPSGANSSAFPYWLVGSALPSDMLITKAWIAPASAVLAMAVMDFRRMVTFRFSVLDLPMAIWCVWPVLQAMGNTASRPGPLLASAYLIGVWGFPWLLGRLYFGNPEDRKSLLTGLAWSAIACLPFALWEGLFAPDLYAVFYEPHPFAKDGIDRYLGWRPIVFFENGNQYGLWVCLCALAALWVWRSNANSNHGAAWKWGAVVALGIALLSQSVGAILLLVFGWVVVEVMGRMRMQRLVMGALVATALLGTVYLSGTAPITHWGKETVVGRKIVDSFRSAGRGSLPWRISQDQKAIAVIKPVAIVGHGQWDWWSALGTRPWGLALLIVGQFGVVGLLCALGALAAPAVKTILDSKVECQWVPGGAPTILAVIVLLALLDAILNSFFFYPAILAASALVVPAGNPQLQTQMAERVG